MRGTNIHSLCLLQVVFDMDHTMVGDLVSLSDRDNIETNVPWTYWPEGKEQGLSPFASSAHSGGGADFNDLLITGILILETHMIPLHEALVYKFI